MKPGIIAGILGVSMLFSVHGTYAGGDYSKDKKAKQETAEMSQENTEMAQEKVAVDIVDTAVAAGTFTTLAKALEAADLVDALKGEGPLTVFAPTDEAFAKIPEETLNAILADKDKLTKILTYHVVNGSVPAADVTSLESAETLAGVDIAIDSSDGVKVNDANVVQTDIMASNGIIHVIDSVLLPPEG